MAEELKQAKPKKDNWFTRFIDKIGEANDKKFSGQIPDCCGGVRGSRKGQPAGPAQHKR
jgi:hypothetical protein